MTADTSMTTDDRGTDIVDTAVGAGSFATLVTAVQAAELEETLRGDGPFTVFAPTDDAFAAPAGRHARHAARRSDRRPRRHPHLSRRRG